MKCFYHNEKDAVGICKNCSKGICVDCAVDVGNGIACKETCVEEVKVINNLINSSKTSGTTNKFFAYLMIIIGGAYLINAGVSFFKGHLNFTTLLIGLALFLFGSYSVFNSRG